MQQMEDLLRSVQQPDTGPRSLEEIDAITTQLELGITNVELFVQMVSYSELTYPLQDLTTTHRLLLNAQLTL